MEWFIALIAVGVLGFAAMAASGGLGQFGPVHIDRVSLDLPSTPLTSQGISKLSFTVVPRGYAMEQVDLVLARLEEQLKSEPDASRSSIAQESGIIEPDKLNDQRNHDGSDETSHG
ncbi:MAG: DivIVA domain-containing protein [Propionibacteriaceae bacterium]|jgi:DivIVA domain-containing protein|nr:DivIVA domain-containing protein [Propionibacteriaceae bacterium]